MPRLDWDRERRRKLARAAAEPKPAYLEARERELARAASRFLAANQQPVRSKRRSRTSDPGLRQSKPLRDSYSAKLPFLATIRAGDRAYVVEVSRFGLRFIRWGDQQRGARANS
jgi:hypothetical protein